LLSVSINVAGGNCTPLIATGMPRSNVISTISGSSGAFSGDTDN
jgi:hypothetical protein